ncbi:hypothetical protein ACFRSX_32590 [Streptomyces goshikiensis]|uniref:hypothetical protein n=1 Tax=Streptomyces TaxID=1883 RepID=UPI000C2805C0|nr:hypothetical protein [Streptomyces sp. CB02120-2]PJN14524.1 hypothetical protein CG724_33055 [Streptomyces sp. CB02120-2]
MARTYNDRPAHLQSQERPWISHLKDGSRKWYQQAAHKRDRAAVRLALRLGVEPPPPQRRCVDCDMH